MRYTIGYRNHELDCQVALYLFCSPHTAQTAIIENLYSQAGPNMPYGNGTITNAKEDTDMPTCTSCSNASSVPGAYATNFLVHLVYYAHSAVATCGPLCLVRLWPQVYTLSLLAGPQVS